MRRIRWTLGITMIVLLVSLALPAAAQDGAASAGPPSASAGSFASAFFISRTASATGETSIEWLGSLIIWFLLILSVVSIGLIGNLALANQRKVLLPIGVIQETKRLLAEAKFREALELTSKDVSYFSKVLHSSLAEASHGFSAMIRRLEQTSDELTTMRLRRIEFLNVLGQVSPMIGLFGTVYGMILAFQAIVASGGTADPILLAGGIGTALVTTFWGLVVAIPALAGYAIIRNRIDELTTEATLLAEEFVNQFRSKPTSAGAPSALRDIDEPGAEVPKPRPVRRAAAKSTDAPKSPEADAP